MYKLLYDGEEYITEAETVEECMDVITEHYKDYLEDKKAYPEEYMHDTGFPFHLYMIYADLTPTNLEELVKNRS